MTNSLLLKMTIEIVDFPSYKMVIFHSYVKLPEGKCHSGIHVVPVVVTLGLLTPINTSEVSRSVDVRLHC